eukprot:Filipodium_phascolosomae@DN528_c0_g1_i1.p1
MKPSLCTISKQSISIENRDETAPVKNQKEYFFQMLVSVGEGIRRRLIKVEADDLSEISSIFKELLTDDELATKDSCPRDGVKLTLKDDDPEAFQILLEVQKVCALLGGAVKHCKISTDLSALKLMKTWKLARKYNCGTVERYLHSIAGSCLNSHMFPNEINSTVGAYFPIKWGKRCLEKIAVEVSYTPHCLWGKEHKCWCVKCLRKPVEEYYVLLGSFSVGDAVQLQKLVVRQMTEMNSKIMTLYSDRADSDS